MSRNALHDSLFSKLRKDTGAKWGEYYSKRADEILDRLFPPQLDFVKDPARSKAALCPRRAGKSVASVSYMLNVALRKADAQVLYITLTRGTAKRIAWSELKKLNRMFELVDPTKGFHETDLIMRFENQSCIQLAGCETMADVEKFRGGQYDLVIIDECASMQAELFMSLIVDAIMPTLSDRKGTLAIIGTPGRTLTGPFYESTGPVAFKIGPHPDQRQFQGINYAMSRPYAERAHDRWDDVMFSYSFHRWMTKDNTANPGIWEDQQRIKVMNGWDDEHPQWRREYLGQWVADDSGFVYRYSSERNDWEPNDKSANPFGLPEDHDWRYVIGIDLGYDDDTAIEVAAWSETSPEFYHLGLGVNVGQLDVAQLAAEVARLAEQFDPDVIVADRGGLGKMVVETLNRTYGLPVEAAEKSEKRDHIELLNSDLLRGRCKIRKGSTLAYQMSILQWDEKNPKIEDRDTPNHACFVAGTPVQTVDGPVPIEQLKMGDMVWTRNGPRPVTAVIDHGEMPTVQVEFSNGIKLRGTPDHKVFTNRGDVELAKLTTDHMLGVWGNTESLKSLSSKASNTGDTPNRRALAYAITTARRLASRSIEKSGGIATAKYQTGTTSTTLMAILSTTLWRIWNWLKQAPTFVSTLADQTALRLRRRALRLRAWLRRLGIGRQRDVSGTVVTLEWLQSALNRVYESAPYAGASSRQNVWLASAAPHAKPRLGDAPASTMRISLVSGARESFARTSMPSLGSVHCRALRVTEMPPARVYDVTVAGEHEYFANGVLVSNCDAFVYVWRYCYHHFNRKKHVQVEVGSPEYWAEKMREAADNAGRKKQRMLEMAWDERVADKLQLDQGPIEMGEEWN